MIRTSYTTTPIGGKSESSGTVIRSGGINRGMSSHKLNQLTLAQKKREGRPSHCGEGH